METQNKQRKYDEKGTVSRPDWLSLFNQILVFDFKLQIFKLKIFTHLFLFVLHFLSVCLIIENVKIVIQTFLPQRQLRV